MVVTKQQKGDGEDVPIGHITRMPEYRCTTKVLIRADGRKENETD